MRSFCLSNLRQCNILLHFAVAAVKFTFISGSKMCHVSSIWSLFGRPATIKMIEARVSRKPLCFTTQSTYEPFCSFWLFSTLLQSKIVFHNMTLTMKEAIVSGDRVVIKNSPRPIAGPEQVLIKVVVSGSNPKTGQSALPRLRPPPSVMMPCFNLYKY
jgi:hypothetical protein